MYGEKFFDEILESLLPGKWSRWIAGSTITLAGLSWYLPQFLQGLGLQFPILKKLLPQIIGPITLLFLGSFVLLVIALFNNRKLNKNILSLPTAPISQGGFSSLLLENRKEKIHQWKEDISLHRGDFSSFRKTYTFNELKAELSPKELESFCPEVRYDKNGRMIIDISITRGKQVDKMGRFQEIVSKKEKDWGIY